MVRKFILAVVLVLTLTATAFAQQELDANADGKIDTNLLPISDLAFGALWNNNTDAPSKNATYDAIAALYSSTLGVGVGDANLGAFTGTTIADNQSVKAALQALETAVEGKEPTQAAASQPEAEAGTEAGIRSFSPLRIAQAIAALASSSSGDVTGVGDCASGACLDGTSDGGTYVRLYDGNSHYTQITAGDSAGNLNFTLPTAAPAGNNALVVMATTGVMSTLPSSTYQAADTELGQFAALSPAQGDILYYNGAAWVLLTTGVSGQYLQTQGVGANPQWASTSVSGDIEAVGDVTSGSAFTGAGGGNTLYFEGATANDFEIALTGADPTADVTVTIPAATGTIVLGPATFGADNRLVKTDYAADKVTLTQVTGITVDDSNNVSGVGTLAITSATATSFVAVGADPADAGSIRLPNAGYIFSEADAAGVDISVIGVDSSEVIQIGASGASGVTVTPALTVTGTLTANGGIVMGTGDGLTVNGVNLLSGDELDGTKIKDADYGDVTINAAGVWSVEDDSHAHGSTTITLASTNLTDTSNIARLDASNTFTGTTNTVGNANTDILAVQATLRGVGRAVSIDDDTTTAPTYATGTGELFVSGDIEAGGTIYAQSFILSGTGDSYIDLTSNGSYPAAAGNNSIAVVSNAWKIKENGTEKDLVTADNSVTWTGATQSFAGVTNMVLPTATPDASGEIGIIAGNILAYHDGAAVIRIDTTGVADGKILKWVAANGAFEIADDATAGSPTLDTIGDPAGDTTIEMNAAEEVNFDYTGNFTAGSQFRVRQVTGNPSGGVLFEVIGTDTDITLAKIGDGTNGVTVSASGALTAAGTGTIVATGLSAGTAPVPATAGGVALGSATAEWDHLYLHDAAVIYGQADQSNTLTSAATGWTANLEFAARSFVPTAAANAAGEFGYTSNAFSWFANSEDMVATASANLWTFSSGTSATFAFTPQVTFTANPRIYDGDSHHATLDVADLSGDVTITIPATAGTLALLGAPVVSANDPDLSAEGQLSWDANGDVLRGHDGTRQVAVARVREEIHVTIYKPQDLDDAQRDHFWIWSNESGMTFVVTGWKGWSTSDDTTLAIMEEDADGANDATVDAVELATGAGPYTGADTTITAANIENGHLLYLDFDDTDAPAMVKLVIYGYYNADVN